MAVGGRTGVQRVGEGARTSIQMEMGSWPKVVQDCKMAEPLRSASLLSASVEREERSWWGKRHRGLHTAAVAKMLRQS